MTTKPTLSRLHRGIGIVGVLKPMVSQPYLAIVACVAPSGRAFHQAQEFVTTNDRIEAQDHLESMMRDAEGYADVFADEIETVRRDTAQAVVLEVETNV